MCGVCGCGRGGWWEGRGVRCAGGRVGGEQVRGGVEGGCWERAELVVGNRTCSFSLIIVSHTTT